MSGAWEVQTRQAGCGEIAAWAEGLGPDWLGRRERDELARWRDPGRRQAWQAGRLLAKRMILDGLGAAEARPGGRAPDRQAKMGFAPSRIEILSRDGQGRPVRPRVRMDGCELPCSLSISHTAQRVGVALAMAHGVSVGIDLTPLAEYGEGFLEMWFTPAERAALRPAGPDTAATFWAVKEAVFKACSAGEKFAPRCVEVRPAGTGFACTYRGVEVSDLAEIRTLAAHGHAAAIVAVDKRRYTERRSRQGDKSNFGADALLTNGISSPKLDLSPSVVPWGSRRRA